MGSTAFSESPCMKQGGSIGLMDFGSAFNLICVAEGQTGRQRPLVTGTSAPNATPMPRTDSARRHQFSFSDHRCRGQRIALPSLIPMKHVCLSVVSRHPWLSADIHQDQSPSIVISHVYRDQPSLTTLIDNFQSLSGRYILP